MYHLSLQSNLTRMLRHRRSQQVNNHHLPPPNNSSRSSMAATNMMEASPLQIGEHIGVRTQIGKLPSPRHRRLQSNQIAVGSSASGRHGIFMHLEGKHGFEAKMGIKYSEFTSGKPLKMVTKSSLALEPAEEDCGSNGSPHEGIPEQQKRTAKIHDFCFGIPFGGFILGGNLVGFLFTRNLTVLGIGALFGGALLTLSTCSLKVWKQGKSSLPFILGQTAIAAILLLKNLQIYTMTKKLLPGGLYALLSSAMLLFYIYVMVSGGNPPPKKLKIAATSAT